MAKLQTRRLLLQPCQASDRADFIALEADPEVMRFLNGGHPVAGETVDPDAGFLQPRGGEPHVWTVRHVADGGFVGWLCLWPETGGQAELGYRFHRGEWGRGLASEAAAVLIDWGFREAGYTRIFACTNAGNHASRRVMAKIGMTPLCTDAPDWLDPPAALPGQEVWYDLRRPADL